MSYDTYVSCLGNIYFSDDYDDSPCDMCGDIDRYLGTFETMEDLALFLKFEDGNGWNDDYIEEVTGYTFEVEKTRNVTISFPTYIWRDINGSVQLYDTPPTEEEKSRATHPIFGSPKKLDGSYFICKAEDMEDLTWWLLNRNVDKKEIERLTGYRYVLVKGKEKENE